MTYKPSVAGHSVLPEHINLRDFLATGDFFGLGGTSTRADVELRLGPPDDVGLVSRKHKLPRIWVYGGIELTFGDHRDSTLELIHFDHPNLPPPGSETLTVDPWILREQASLESISDACCKAGIDFQHFPDANFRHWRTSGNVHLLFSEDPDDSGLYAASLVFGD